MSKQRGFTLIELMIVVAVVALLAGIAIPVYNDQVMRTRRAEGKATLLEAAQGLERCFTRYSAYNDGNCNVAATLGGAGVQSEEQHYTVTGVVTATTFALTAAPQGGQATRDTDCASFTLDQTGLRGVSGPKGATQAGIQECW